MNITKEKIKEWFKDNYPNAIGSYQMVNKLEEPMLDIIQECFNDLSPKWVSVDGYSKKLKDGQLCWVQFPDDSIKLCRLNDYKQYGGNVDYWQDLNGNDLFMNCTKFIAIDTPEPPK